MGLIKCPDCGKEISERADKCPFCGCPSSVFAGAEQVQPVTETNTQESVDTVSIQDPPSIEKNKTAQGKNVNIQQSTEQKAGKKKKGNKLWIVALVLVIFAVGIWIIAKISTPKGIDYVSIVQNGYLGEYNDITIKERFEDFFDETYSDLTWNEGVFGDDNLPAVEFKAQKDKTGMGLKDASVFFVFPIANNSEQFTVVNIFLNDTDDYKRTEMAEQLNTIYAAYYSTQYGDDADAATKFAEKMEKINGVAVMYGHSADYKGTWKDTSDAIGDPELDMNVLELLGYNLGISDENTENVSVQDTDEETTPTPNVDSISDFSKPIRGSDYVVGSAVDPEGIYTLEYNSAQMTYECRETELNSSMYFTDKDGQYYIDIVKAQSYSPAKNGMDTALLEFQGTYEPYGDVVEYKTEKGYTCYISLGAIDSGGDYELIFIDLPTVTYRIWGEMENGQKASDEFTNNMLDLVENMVPYETENYTDEINNEISEIKGIYSGHYTEEDGVYSGFSLKLYETSWGQEYHLFDDDGQFEVVLSEENEWEYHIWLDNEMRILYINEERDGHVYIQICDGEDGSHIGTWVSD